MVTKKRVLGISGRDRSPDGDRKLGFLLVCGTELHCMGKGPSWGHWLQYAYLESGHLTVESRTSFHFFGYRAIVSFNRNVLQWSLPITKSLGSN
ncbi:hypothetical protein AVEN_250035-1 [Araneus ventricosus]|uniref:Uncharacterized protein n=1 Tax=Araneus ventricosus TaxID=182803 RepID=A0A4Y2J517_ARAVE|nr:hypothetical protein AVEN_250035-1 [Araneus ventricosus]